MLRWIREHQDPLVATMLAAVWAGALAATLYLASVAPVRADEDPDYCKGMARSSDRAACPDARAKKASLALAQAKPSRVPYCFAEGRDCVVWLQQAGRPAYCGWASGMARVGAFQREQYEAGETPTQLAKPLTMVRAYTANELAHIRWWLQWGFDKKISPYLIGEVAYQWCMQGYPEV